MARYVVVEFDDDATAQSLCERIDAATNAGKNYRVAGVFYRPTRWCECPHPDGYAPNQVALGAKYNLWTCLVCRRPRRGTHNPHNLIPVGDRRLGITPWTTLVPNISIFEVLTERVARNAAD